MRRRGKLHRNFRHGFASNAGDGGKRYSRTYRTWLSMKARCNPNTASNSARRTYAGRGITVCDRWTDFTNFLADMGERPEGMTLDRIDPSGNYEPSNCRWATIQMQNRNRRSNRVLTVDGVAKTLAEWSAEYGVGHTSILARLKMGWTAERAVRQPARKIKPWKRTRAKEAV